MIFEYTTLGGAVIYLSSGQSYALADEHKNTRLAAIRKIHTKSAADTKRWALSLAKQPKRIK